MEHTIKFKDEEPAYNKQFRIPEEHRSILIEHLQNWLRLGVTYKPKEFFVNQYTYWRP